MDHEYDAQADDDDAKTTDEGPESAENGPSAAHFREAARLAAARARKALEDPQKTAGPGDVNASRTIAPEDFKKAATRHARSSSGRGRKTAAKKTKKSANETTTDQQVTGTEESIALLDERLHLGARMLRAFESQIQRLEEAGATMSTEPAPVEDTATEALCARLDAMLTKASQVETRLKSIISRAEDIAAGLGNGIEICNAIQSGTQERARQIAELEGAQQQRSDALIERTQTALTRMEQTLENAQEMATTVERRLDASSGKFVPQRTPKQNPPVIEIHARTPPARDAERNETPRIKEPPTAESDESGERFSLGTLSVETGRARLDTPTP